MPRPMRSLMILLVLGVLVGVLLGACQSTDEPPNSTPAGPAADAEAGAYAPPTAPITAENANQITRLGLLTVPGSRVSTVFAYDFSPDGTRLAGLTNELLVAWDTVRGDVVFNSSRGEATHVYYSPDKSELFVLAATGEVAIYDAENGGVQNRLRGLESYNGSQAYEDFEGWLALGGDDGSVQIWDTLERTALRTLPAHNVPVDRILFSPDGTLMATNGRGVTITVWDTATWEALASYDHSDETVESMAFSPDGELLVTGSLNRLRIWSVATGELLYNRTLQEGGAREILAFSPDGRYLISGGSSAALTVWDPQEGNIVAQIPEVSGNRMSAAFSPDGTLMVTALMEGGVSLWNLAASTEQTIPQAPLQTRTPRIVNAAWSADGFVLALFDADGTVEIWGIRSTD